MFSALMNADEILLVLQYFKGVFLSLVNIFLYLVFVY